MKNDEYEKKLRKLYAMAIEQGDVATALALLEKLRPYDN